MKTYKQYNVKMPVYALSYLINADSSGLEEHDKQIIDRYINKFYHKAESVSGSVVIECPESDPYFTWRPAFGLACDVLDTTITILI